MLCFVLLPVPYILSGRPDEVSNDREGLLTITRLYKEHRSYFTPRKENSELFTVLNYLGYVLKGVAYDFVRSMALIN